MSAITSSARASQRGRSFEAKCSGGVKVDDARAAPSAVSRAAQAGRRGVSSGGRRKHGLVAAKALAQREFHVALEPRPGRNEMILSGTLARSEHGRPRARHPQPLIGQKCLIEIVTVARDRGRQHAGVLDRHGRALAEIRQHGVRGIAKQRHPPLAPSRERFAIVERPFVPALARGVEAQQVGMPAGIGCRQLGEVAFPRPGFLGQDSPVSASLSKCATMLTSSPRRTG